MNKPYCMALLFLIALSLVAVAHSQTESNAAEAPRRPPTLADFGLAYPLSSDWVLATEMSRHKVESENPSGNFDVLLSAVYVPKSKIGATAPFFTVVAYRQPATNCKQNLEAMIAHSQQVRIEGGVTEFTAAGRGYYRIDSRERGDRGRHDATFCTAANGHLLVWYGGAANEKGLDEILSTLNSITAFPSSSTRASAPPPGPEDGNQPTPAKPERVRISSGVSAGLLIKKVNPIYPPEARAAYIQGTVVLRAQISKTGDITDLELVSGPLELAGSAVNAVRQWKYRPYLLLGEPVTVDTQIQVNYALSR